MRDVDLSAYSSQQPSRIKPEKMDLGELPPIEPVRSKPKSDQLAPTSEPETTVSQSPTKEAQSERNTDRSSERTELRTEVRSENRSVTLPLKRRTKRYSFEFYEDQIVKLKQLKIQAEMDGESITLSDMARIAMDEYLQDKQV